MLLCFRRSAPARHFAETGDADTARHLTEGVMIPLLQSSIDSNTEERLFTAYVLNEESF